MSKVDKLIQRLRSHPKDFTFHEVEKLLSSLGCKRVPSGKTGGSRVSFDLGNGEYYEMHRPHQHKELREYQILKLIKTLERNGLI